jgi:hypothetical protein
MTPRQRLRATYLRFYPRVAFSLAAVIFVTYIGISGFLSIVCSLLLGLGMAFVVSGYVAWVRSPYPASAPEIPAEDSTDVGL